MTTSRVRAVTAAVNAATTSAGDGVDGEGAVRSVAAARLDGPARREVAVVADDDVVAGADAETLEHDADAPR